MRLIQSAFESHLLFEKPDSTCKLKNIMRRPLLVGTLLVFAAPFAAAEEVVRVFGWYDYVSAGTLKRFEVETGIKVKYDTFDSAEVLETKLMTGGSGYDVVFPGISMVGRLLQANALQPTDMKKMRSASEMDPQLLDQLSASDPTNEYAVPFAWGTTLLAFNRVEILKRIPNAPIGSLDLLFKPEYASKLKDCGIAVVDAPAEVISIALNYLGKPPFSKESADLKEVGNLLTQLRPSLRYIASGTQASDLANGNICLGLMYNGDAIQAKMQAATAKKSFKVEYTIPKEGTLTWLDALAIPVDAPHPTQAKKFIEFITRPEFMADLTNRFYYANANVVSLSMVDKSLSDDPSIFPSPGVRSTLFGEEPLPKKSLRERTRIWAMFRSGH